MCKSIKIIVLIFCGILQKSAGKLHNGFVACKVQEGNFEACLNTAIENGIKFLKNGLPDYNLLPLDPLFISSLKIGAGTGAVHLVQNYQNITMKGFSDLTVNNSRVDLNKKTLSFSIMHPRILQNARYDIDGKILMLPVRGKGHSTLDLENCFSNHLIEFNEKKKGDNVHFIPKSYTMKLNPSHVRYLFENLFNGNKLLGDNINKLINDEWLTIFQDVGAGYEVAYANIFMRYAKGIFERTPVTEIFL